jgi:hypothetical protein
VYSIIVIIWPKAAGRDSLIIGSDLRPDACDGVFGMPAVI